MWRSKVGPRFVLQLKYDTHSGFAWDLLNSASTIPAGAQYGMVNKRVTTKRWVTSYRLRTLGEVKSHDSKPYTFWPGKEELGFAQRMGKLCVLCRLAQNHQRIVQEWSWAWLKLGLLRLTILISTAIESTFHAIYHPPLPPILLEFNFENFVSRPITPQCLTMSRLPGRKTERRRAPLLLWLYDFGARIKFEKKKKTERTLVSSRTRGRHLLPDTRDVDDNGKAEWTDLHSKLRRKQCCRAWGSRSWYLNCVPRVKLGFALHLKDGCTHLLYLPPFLWPPYPLKWPIIQVKPWAETGHRLRSGGYPTCFKLQSLAIGEYVAGAKDSHLKVHFLCLQEVWLKWEVCSARKQNARKQSARSTTHLERLLPIYSAQSTMTHSTSFQDTSRFTDKLTQGGRNSMDPGAV